MRDMDSIDRPRASEAASPPERQGDTALAEGPTIILGCRARVERHPIIVKPRRRVRRIKPTPARILTLMD